MFGLPSPHPRLVSLRCPRKTRPFRTSPRLRLHTQCAEIPGKPFDILFFGRDEFSCVVLEQLYASRDVWDGIWIATQPDMKVGRRGSLTSVSHLKQLGERLNIPAHTIPQDKPSFKFWQPPTPLCSLPPPPSRLLVTASFGRILPKSLLELFAPSRRLNVHPSLLPAYRGAAPIQHTLIDGVKETGVSVIEMLERKKGIDAGEIWGSRNMAVPDGIEFSALRQQLAIEGGQLLVSVLRDMMNGKAKCIAQPWDPNAPRAPLITGDDSLVNFTMMSAEEVVRRHRAISHQKPLFTKLRTGKTLQLHNLCVFEDPDSSLLNHLPDTASAIYHPPTKSIIIRCAANTILRVEKVKQQDRSLISAKDWWNGVRPDMRPDNKEQGPVHFTL